MRHQTWVALLLLIATARARPSPDASRIPSPGSADLQALACGEHAEATVDGHCRCLEGFSACLGEHCSHALTAEGKTVAGYRASCTSCRCTSSAEVATGAPPQVEDDNDINHGDDDGNGDLAVEPVPNTLTRAEMEQLFESDNHGVKLYVGVLSAAGNVARRNAVRSSWGADPRLTAVRFFVAAPTDRDVYQRLLTESAALGDVIVLPSFEDYDRITYQTSDIFRFAAASASTGTRITHVMKCDDDTYVWTNRLLPRLAKMPAALASLGRFQRPGAKVSRRGRFKMSEEDYPDRTVESPYPHGGAGYVCTLDIAQRIAAGIPLFDAPNGKTLARLEDVSYGRWLTAVERTFKVRIFRDLDERFNAVGCHPRDLSSHYINSGKFDCMLREGRCCEKPSRHPALPPKAVWTDEDRKKWHVENVFLLPEDS
eukprot:m.304965 g.304965  ORF g.304965 m.304965 type:complete len:428 (-) comp17379_c0_seq1:110-1393(-)